MRYTVKISPEVLRTWNARQVREWAINDVRIGAEDAKLLLNKITGTISYRLNSHHTGIRLLKLEDFTRCGIPVEPALDLEQALAELKGLPSLGTSLIFVLN
jgi:hypothetical protein